MAAGVRKIPRSTPDWRSFDGHDVERELAVRVDAGRSGFVYSDAWVRGVLLRSRKSDAAMIIATAAMAIQSKFPPGNWKPWLTGAALTVSVSGAEAWLTLLDVIPITRAYTL